MRKFHKKAALELSINAIVIVILAMTLLGLGLGFVRNMFTDITDTTSQVQDQMKEQILDDLRRGDKKLSFPSQRIEMEGGDEEILAIGVKNTEASTLNFQIQLSEINGTTEEQIASSDSLATSNTIKYAYFWDSTTQTLSPGESNVYGIAVKADKTASGTRLFKVMINDTSDQSEYTAKTFFVKFL